MNDLPYKVFTKAHDVETTGDALIRSLTWPHRIGFDIASALYDRKTSADRKKAKAALADGPLAVGFDPSDTAVTILIDHSGSMRGDRATLTCFATELLSLLLTQMAVDHEILGFTTVNWRGGLSRQDWEAAGRPEHPGRLNDLLHIVYKSFSGDENGAPRSIRNLLRDELLKENIDGEALAWAASRLHMHDKANRHLIMVSDGAPVDDSTLSENSPEFLWNHLKKVISEVSANDRIQLHAIGVEFEMHRLFENSITIRDTGTAATDLPAFLLSSLR